MCPPNQQPQEGNWSDKFLGIFESGNFWDVTIRVDNREMRLHSQILMAQSPVFATMFTSQFKERATRTVEIDDVNFETATHFFKFLYTGVSSVSSFSESVELFKMAHKYQVVLLENQMVENIKNQISKDNCLEVFVLATTFNCTALRDAALKIAARTKLCELQQDPSYRELDSDDIRCFLEGMMSE
eukprot:Selendium_serpulae@DN6423_c3_g1_i9.p1